MKRLMIYFFFDKDGIVDDYVPYFLQSFRPFCEETCVVVNGKLADKSKPKLENSCDKLLIRENIGFDSSAYKYAIEYYGYEKLKEYDELILANFTIFGPIFSPKEIFDKMENRNLDFWGITKHPAEKSNFAGVKIDEHIQSYFMAFNNSILISDDFKNYWNNLKIATNYEEAVAFHELKATKYFSNLGFKSDTFIDFNKYSEKLKNRVYYYYINQQVEEDRMPFIKRKIFCIKKGAFIHPVKNGINTLFTFIRLHTDYDLQLIEENIIRTDLYKTNFVKLVLRYINLIICQLIFWNKQEHYKTKLESVKQVYEILKDKNQRTN